LQALIRLPDTVAQPGPLCLWPYQREIADAITDPACERVTLLKPTRAGEAPRLRLAARAAWP
jgi:phage terminase large subunit GpA-like protein